MGEPLTVGMSYHCNIDGNNYLVTGHNTSRNIGKNAGPKGHQEVNPDWKKYDENHDIADAPPASNSQQGIFWNGISAPESSFQKNIKANTGTGFDISAFNKEGSYGFSSPQGLAETVGKLKSAVAAILKNWKKDHGLPETSAPQTGQQTFSGKSSYTPTPNSQKTPTNKSVDGGGALGGVNTAPDRISSPEAATEMVDQVKNAGGGTLRIQFTHEQMNNPAEMAKLQALVEAGDKKNVKIQVTFRDNANGGGGIVLTGGALQQASTDLKNLVSKFGEHPSFVLDTFNEGGTSATQGWADMQSTLIKSARDAGYKGDIVVEDSNWGGGLTAGPESGLVKYASQLNAANGSGNPGLIGSIHEYNNGADSSSRLTQEIKALQGAGYRIQIGEVGNANWLGGSNFEPRYNAVKAVQDNIDLLREAGATVLPWMDQFVNGQISHTVGFSAKDQMI